MRSTTAPEISATVMMQKVAWKAKKRRCGIVCGSAVPITLRGSRVTSLRKA